MADVTMYHPDLKETVVVSERRARVMEKSGWTKEVPKKYQDSDDQKEA